MQTSESVKNDSFRSMIYVLLCLDPLLLVRCIFLTNCIVCTFNSHKFLKSTITSRYMITDSIDLKQINIVNMFSLVAMQIKSTVPDSIKLIVTAHMRQYNGHLTVCPGPISMHFKYLVA